MNSTAGLLLVLFLVVAVADWVAVHLGNEGLERLAKPGCMVVLIAAALAIDPADGAARVLLVLALLASTAGDVLLMLRERELRPGITTFVAGLGAFLVAHVFYVAGFALEGVSVAGLVLGIIPVAVLALVVGQRVVTGVRGSDEPELAEPVLAYTAVISAMVLFAFGTEDPRAMAGALLFAGSDSLIAWQRFIKEWPWGPVAVIVSYHLAQALLVTSFT